jgi:K+-transporting ATPase ATPase C chain
MKMLLQQARISLIMLVLMTGLTGLAYPLAMTGIAQTLFPDQAGGSLIERGDTVIGSSLIGQNFVDPATGQTLAGYFRGRPSAAGTGYDASASGGSNLGPTNQELLDRMTADVAIIRQENGLDPSVAIPVDLVTSSASGLDPHISPASAVLQIHRVARQRGVSDDQVHQLVDAHTSIRLFGFFGESRVNVLELNLALDTMFPRG